MEREIIRLLPYIVLGTLVVGVLLFLLSLQQLQRRRTGAYWRVRRQAGERGGKLFLASVTLITLAVVAGIITGIGTLIYRNNNRYLDRGPDDLYGIILSPEARLTATSEAIALVASATLIPSETPTPAPTTAEAPTLAAATLTPTIPTPSATFTASATATFIPTLSPTPNFAVVLNLTPIFNTTPRPARPGFRLSLDSATDGVDADGQAPGHEFKAGIKRVYLFMSFGSMENGVAWSRVLYRDGQPIQGNTLLWSLGASGSSYFFFGDETGYVAGAYEVRLYVGEQEVSRFSFEVKA
ncbi:MAG: hypothetical protein GC204_16925 [Chloroflexi bacterium]|nr:hypothetical protein [Chloroflexota bacterium]